MHDRGVVKFLRLWRGFLRCACDIGAVQRTAQGAAFCKLHHRQIARHFERQFVTRLVLGNRCGAGGVLYVFGDAIKFHGSRKVAKSIGRIECVFAELLAQLGLAFLNLCEAFSRWALELCASKHKVAHSVFMRLLLFCGEVFGLHGFVLGVQALVGA